MTNHIYAAVIDPQILLLKNVKEILHHSLNFEQSSLTYTSALHHYIAKIGQIIFEQHHLTVPTNLGTLLQQIIRQTPFTFLFARWIIAGSTCPNSQQSTRNGTRKEKPNGIHPKTLSTNYLRVLCQRKSVRDQIRLHGSAFAAHTKEKTRIYHKRSSYDQFR